jgi:hypothetical protein
VPRYGNVNSTGRSTESLGRMPSENDKFARYTEFARKPSTWTDDARRHMAVAELLWHARNDPGRTFYETSGCFYSAMFHASVAVETAHKAVRIRREPSLIENGALRQQAFKGIGHKLVVPVGQILNDLTPRENELLLKLEKFSEMGRYSILNDGAPLINPDLMNLLGNFGIDEIGEYRAIVERLCAIALKETHAA